MKRKEILTELINIAEKIGIKIIEDKLLNKGGYCRVFQDRYIILDKRISDEEKIEILASAMKKNDLDNIYMAPKIREICSDEE